MNKEEQTQQLISILEQSDYVIHTVLKHVSRSGMSRSISCKLITGKNEILHIDYLVKEIMGWKIDKNNNGIKIGGCGMDMGFHLVYSLSHKLFKDGYKIKQEWIG